MYCTFLLEIKLFACYYLLIIYRYKSLDLKCISNTNDLIPIKPQMAAILDLFFTETLEVINGFRMSNCSVITTSTWRLWPFRILPKKRMFRSGETFRLFTGNKGRHFEHILRF